MNRTSRAILIGVAAFLMMGLTGSALAHPPYKVALDYNATTKTLTVVALHGVGDPENHYIYKIDVYKNKDVVEKRELKGQTTKKFQLAVFEIKDLAAGDVLKVKASCNKMGSKTATLENKPEEMKKASDAMRKFRRETDDLAKKLDAVFLDMKKKAKETPKEAKQAAMDTVKDTLTTATVPSKTVVPAPKPEK